MEKTLYERHTYQHFKSKEMPFICHNQLIRADAIQNSYLHWHENPEFLRCTAGEGEVISAANKLPFREENLVTVNHNALHNINNSPDAKSELLFHCLIIDANFCRENGVQVEALQFRPLIQDEEAIRLYDRAFSACTAPGTFQSLVARTCVLEFLRHLCLYHLDATDSTSSANNTEEIKKVINYLRNNYGEPITLQQAADLAGFSVYYFSRTFKKVTGRTFVTFLNTVRCESAARMLRRGASVTETCYACGFHELGYFSRTFRHNMGIPPSAVKKMK